MLLFHGLQELVTVRSTMRLSYNNAIYIFKQTFIGLRQPKAGLKQLLKTKYTISVGLHITITITFVLFVLSFN